jgi:tetratricopeptide (TPR) repeat protein
MCDNTHLKIAELKKMFKMSPASLVKYIKKKGINLEIFCTKNRGVFTKWCDPKIKRESFKKRYSLQGQFLGRENTILLKANAYKGSLIHEYIHAQQYLNNKKIYGHRYKYERSHIERKAIKRMDQIIRIVKKDEAKLKKENKLSPYLKEMVALSQGVQRFSKWQDLIDERGIFLVYLKYGKLIGATKEDIALAQKNMGFICKRSDLRYMSKQFCPKSKQEVVSFQVKSLIKELRPKPDFTLINKFIQGVPSRPQKSLKKNIELVTNYIFNEWKIKPDTSYKSIQQKDNILPDTTLDVRHAHCVGLSTLYLLAFEKMGIYAELIRIPRHVLVKACDLKKSVCHYIETLKKGKIVDKNFYLKNNYTTVNEVRGTFYFRSSKLLSSLYLSLGYIANQAKQFGIAEYLYKKSIDNDRRFAEGYANLAGVYQKTGKLRLAKQYNEIALKINPKHIPSIVNKAVLLWNENKKKNEKEVLRILNKAQNINFSYSEIYRVRAQVFEHGKKYKKAFINYLSLLMSSSDCSYYKNLDQLLKKIKDRSFLKKYQLDIKDFAAKCHGV